MDKEEFIVDRIEGQYVIVETSFEKMVSIVRSEIIGDVKEGDILTKRNNKFIIDIEKTLERKIKINSIVEGLWKNDD